MAEPISTTTLTAARLREYLKYDPSSGKFIWIKHRGGRAPKVGSEAGATWTCPNTGIQYVLIGLFGKHYLAHRLAFLWMTGAWPAIQVDHNDRDGLNNRWENLRLAGHSGNKWNTAKRKNNKSGYKGVSFSKTKGKYIAQIMAHRCRYFLGSYDTAKEAYDAYCAAASKLHGAFACVD